MRDIAGDAEAGRPHQPKGVTIPMVQTLKPSAPPRPAAPVQPGQGTAPGQRWGEERRIRSIVKAASWRLTGTLDTVVVSFLITGSLKASFSIGGLELFTKLTLYYFHERLWNRLHFGRQKLPALEYEI
jgi:uncharacterized membrane protein